MTTDRFVRNRARARAALDGGTALANSDAVQKALDMARMRMGTIVEDARKYRIDTEEKISSISDPELRSSVEVFARPPSTRQD